MKIACVDKTTSDRRKLESYVDDAFASQRGIVGHLPQAVLQLFSLEELLYSKRPEIVILGPALSVEEAFSNCRHIRDVFPNIPLVLLFSRENYSLRVLRRFERFSKALFSWDEPHARLVHTLLETRGQDAKPARGKLISCSGTKGGIGVSSVVGALAHAAAATPRKRKDLETAETALSVVILDLSASGSLLHYLGFRKTSSAEFSTMLVDGLKPERSLVERMISVAPNGISALLPPAGGREIREMWLRDFKRFQLTLQILEIVLELTDIVLVDIAGTEGILPYAILAQADTRVLLSSNDSASIHLLQRQLHELESIPGSANIAVALNLLAPNGLTPSDVSEFILHEENLPELSPGGRIRVLPSIPFDRRGRYWMGTGNTLYTEGTKPLQRLFRDQLRILLGGETTQISGSKRVSKFYDSFLHLASLFYHSSQHTFRTSTGKRLLEWKADSEHRTASPAHRLRPPPSILTNSETPFTPADPETSETPDTERISLSIESEHFPRSEISGSANLEYAIFVSGTLLVAALGIPTFYQSLTRFLLHLTQGG